MDEYLDRADAALAAFDAALGALDHAAAAAPDALPRPALDKLTAIVGRARQASASLGRSVHQMRETALDIVDLQVRLGGEGAALASALKALGDLIAKTPALAPALSAPLQTLDERAERVATALAPNAVQGVREINRALWNFRPLWHEYGRVLAREVTRAGGLTPDQLALLQRTAEDVRAGFDRVDHLLNDLVVLGTAEGPAVRDVIRDARATLGRVVASARSRAADRYKPFHGVLKRGEALARDIDGKFSGLRVPVFPPLDRLTSLHQAIDDARYAALAGVERFALLNICARLRSVTFGPGEADHLLSPQFGIRIFDVFPDRIYFSADRAFLERVRALADLGRFARAPASLHRFNEGSFKQTQFRKGNLQVSWATGTPGSPGDRTRVSVDADIDLYRSSIGHLFGEVLVNHLTGSTTDQFKVWSMLASTDTAPLGGFDVIAV